MPQEMHAVRLHEHGGPEVLRYEAMARPVIADDEVLVEVRACALNHLDLWTRQGRRGTEPIQVDLPRVLGSDVAGIVREAGPRAASHGFPAVGDAVLVFPGGGCGACDWCRRGDDNYCDGYRALGSEMDGGYAQWVKVGGRDVLPMPGHLDFVEAACLPLAYLTAWQMLVRRARLRPGETVLITAVGSGVGTAALQIARLHGARVLATASTPEKIRKALDAGADDGVPSGDGAFAEAIRRMTGGRGVDVVVDSVGSSTFTESLACLAVGGRIASCGATAGAGVALDLHALQAKRASLFFTVMGARADLLDVTRAVERQRIRPHVHEILPLRQAADAHRLLEERGVFGKVVLVPGEA